MIAALVSPVQAPARGGTPQTDQVAPVNIGADPYQVIRDWAQLNLEDKNLGRLQRRGDRSRWQNGLGHRSLLARNHSRLPRHQRESGASFDESGKEIEVLAAACSSGRTAFMWIATATCG